ncbi:hypothetical protein FUA48_16025 [Flavobacterium alkalisoli]|uniref:Uncharacterized protein n=1 Tax=Flavobacterium alkalisoli TaxID=2602769 RepID=A0A5B9FZ12_9FLAO|nr:hypothetical protein [Flavobacterium alkalisoli]QEE51028.1 hypothetical protein FUA48_16025 [Flavobacterium alkalisoli]
MATNINTILSWFQTGDKPTENQFLQTFTSFWHKDDNIPQNKVQDLTATLAAKAEAAQLNGHLTDPEAHADLFDAKANDADISAVGKSGDYGDIINIPISFPPEAHSHAANEIIGMEDYALMTFVQSMSIVFVPASATLSLRDGAGTTIASANLGSLNNEGTSITYNSVDKTLELRNDADELLASIPVADFVANLVSIAGWGSTPGRLQFKSSTGTVLFNVDFDISRINGLQTALDSKLATADAPTTVRGVTLTGFAVSNAAVVAADTILAAAGKLQGQINQIQTDLGTKIALGVNSDIPVLKLEVMNSLAVTDDEGTLSFVKDDSEEYYGKTTLTAPGGTTINIPHGLPGVPTWVNVVAANAAALPGQFAVSCDATNIILTYTGSAPAGTLEYNLSYRS